MGCYWRKTSQSRCGGTSDSFQARCLWRTHIDQSTLLCGPSSALSRWYQHKNNKPKNKFVMVHQSPFHCTHCVLQCVQPRSAFTAESHLGGGFLSWLLWQGGQGQCGPGACWGQTDSTRYGGEDSPFPNKSAAWVDKGASGNTAFPKSTEWVSNRAGVSTRASHNLLNNGWHHFCRGAKSCSVSVIYGEGNPTFPAHPPMCASEGFGVGSSWGCLPQFQSLHLLLILFVFSGNGQAAWSHAQIQVFKSTVLWSCLKSACKGQWFWPCHYI